MRLLLNGGGEYRNGLLRLRNDRHYGRRRRQDWDDCCVESPSADMSEAVVVVEVGVTDTAEARREAGAGQEQVCVRPGFFVRFRVGD